MRKKKKQVKVQKAEEKESMKIGEKKRVEKLEENDECECR